MFQLHENIYRVFSVKFNFHFHFHTNLWPQIDIVWLLYILLLFLSLTTLIVMIFKKKMASFHLYFNFPHYFGNKLQQLFEDKATTNTHTHTQTKTKGKAYAYTYTHTLAREQEKHKSHKNNHNSYIESLYIFCFWAIYFCLLLWVRVKHAPVFLFGI